MIPLWVEGFFDAGDHVVEALQTALAFVIAELPVQRFDGENVELPAQFASGSSSRCHQSGTKTGAVDGRNAACNAWRFREPFAPISRRCAVVKRRFEDRLELSAEHGAPGGRWISRSSISSRSMSSTRSQRKSCPCSRGFSCSSRWQNAWIVKIGVLIELVDACFKSGVCSASF